MSLHEADDLAEGVPLLCSDCFRDSGLRLDADRFGLSSRQPCPNCGSLTGALLDRGRIRWVAHRFFVLGSLTKADYGGTPRIEFNVLRPNEVSFAGELQQDVGLLFPSYFSLLRTGAPFLETAYGLSTRVFPGSASHEAGKVVPNIALFGRPIADGRVDVRCINRLYLRQAAYDLGFGPAEI